MYVTLSLTYLSNLKIKSWRKPEKIVVYSLNKGHVLIIWQIPGTTPPMCRKTTVCLDRMITQIYKKKIQYWVVCEPSDFKIQVLFAKLGLHLYIFSSKYEKFRNRNARSISQIREQNIFLPWWQALCWVKFEW